MANEKKPRRRKKLRQEWNPHWSLKLLYMIFSVAGSVLKIAVGAAATVLLIVLICGTVFVGPLGDYLQEDILTEAADWSLDDYDLEQTSFIYYVDNHGDIQLLQQIYTTTDRQWASIDEIPEDLIHAAVAIEDKRFYEHQGVDWITTMKACLNMFFGGDEQFGGSTITQQLIKNTVLTTWTQEKTLGERIKRKVQEQYLAIQLEKDTNDKSKILEQYMNTINLGQNTLGVQAASKRYFNKNVWELSLSECATIAGITQNPSKYNPLTHPDKNQDRREKVLTNMLEQGYITQVQYDEAESDTDSLYRRIQTANLEVGGDSSVDSYYADAVKEAVTEDLIAAGYTETQAYVMVYSGGLSIFSAMDPDIQAICDSVASDESLYPIIRKTATKTSTSCTALRKRQMKRSRLTKLLRFLTVRKLSANPSP